MNISPEKIICEKNQKYSCTNCDGICCRSFSIKIDYKTKRRLEELEYINKLNKDANCDFEKASDGSYYLPIIEHNNCYKCLFYDQNEKCIIHNRNCFEDKPITCQIFPISSYRDCENNIHIETSFRCKSILENYGENLEDITKSIVSNYINLEYYPKEFKLNSNSIQQSEVFKLTNKLKGILDDNSIPIENSIFKYYKYLKDYKDKYNNNTDILNCIDIIDDYDSYTNKKLPRQIFAKLITGIYLTNLLIYSTFNRKSTLFKDANQIIKEYSKLFISIIQVKNNIKLASSERVINLNDLSKVDFTLDDRSEDLIRRYLKANVIRYKYMSSEGTNLQFLNRVIIYFSLIKILSKHLSLEKNQLVTDFDSISKAISTIELVFYHTKFSISPIKSAEFFLNSLLCKFINEKNTVYYLIKYGLK